MIKLSLLCCKQVVGGVVEAVLSSDRFILVKGSNGRWYYLTESGVYSFFNRLIHEDIYVPHCIGDDYVVATTTINGVAYVWEPGLCSSNLFH